MIHDLSVNSVFFNAYIKEKSVIDAAVVKAVQEAAKKVNIRQAFLVAGLNKNFCSKAA
jgi:hypothetical protein